MLAAAIDGDMKETFVDGVKVTNERLFMRDRRAASLRTDTIVSASEDFNGGCLLSQAMQQQPEPCGSRPPPIPCRSSPSFLADAVALTVGTGWTISTRGDPGVVRSQRSLHSRMCP